MKKQEFPSKECGLNILAMRDSLELLGGKWKLLIVLHLGKNPNELIHFKKLEQQIIGISAKMLSKELKILEENKIITRNKQNTRPITVTYTLTDYGKRLIPIAKDLLKWGLNHRTILKKNWVTDEL